MTLSVEQEVARLEEAAMADGNRANDLRTAVATFSNTLAVFFDGKIMGIYTAVVEYRPSGCMPRHYRIIKVPEGGGALTDVDINITVHPGTVIGLAEFRPGTQG